ncbi:unnamed protein product, partial [Durusdinium trenchii]
AQQSGLVPSMGGSPYASMTGPPVTTMGAYGPPQSVSMGSMAMGSGFGAPPQGGMTAYASASTPPSTGMTQSQRYATVPVQSGVVQMGGNPYATMSGAPGSGVITYQGASTPPQAPASAGFTTGTQRYVSGGDWFSRLDKDGSGALSREEFAQAQQSGLVPSMGGSPYASMTGPPVTTMGAPATYGPPQSVSMGSMAMGSGFGAPPQVSGGDWFSRLDKDGSGALSREEFA